MQAVFGQWEGQEERASGAAPLGAVVNERLLRRPRVQAADEELSRGELAVVAAPLRRGPDRRLPVAPSVRLLLLLSFDVVGCRLLGVALAALLALALVVVVLLGVASCLVVVAALVVTALDEGLVVCFGHP